MKFEIETTNVFDELYLKAEQLTPKEKAVFIALLGASEYGLSFAVDCKKEKIAAKKSAPIDYEKIVRNYNEICKSLQKVTVISQNRKNAMRILCNEFSFEQITEVFRKAEASDFLAGRIKPWHANFDWLLKKNNFVKTLEGNFDNRKVESGECSFATYDLDLFEKMINNFDD